MDLLDLQKSILAAINRELGTVRLIAGTRPGIEYREEDLPPLSTMASFELIPHVSYRFSYFAYRYLLIAFLLERGEEWETGQIEILSTAPEKDPEVENFLPPAVYLKKIVHQATPESGVGVDFGISYDSELSQGGQHQFGITYRVTKPGLVAPKLRAFILGAFSTQETV